MGCSLLFTVAARALHFQQLALSFTTLCEYLSYYLKLGVL